MAEKISVFLPMTPACFEQSFREKIECKNRFVRPNEDKIFIGRYSKGHFTFYYKESITNYSYYVMEGNIDSCDGGIMLSFRRKKMRVSWLDILLYLFYAGWILYDIFIRKIEFTVSFPYELLIILPLVAASLITTILFGERINIDEVLLQKLNEVCCGMLQAEKEVEHNG